LENDIKIYLKEKGYQVKLKVKFVLKQTTKAEKRNRGTSLLFYLGVRWG
jgi:hypothetical protein